MKHKLLTSLAIAALAAVGAAQSPLFRAQILPSEIKAAGPMNNAGWSLVSMRDDLPQYDISLWHPDHGFMHRNVSFGGRKFIATAINNLGTVGGVLKHPETFTQGMMTLNYYSMARIASDDSVFQYNVDVLVDGASMGFLADDGSALFTYRNGNVTFRSNGSWRQEIPVDFSTQLNSVGQVLHAVGGRFRRVNADGAFIEYAPPPPQIISTTLNRHGALALTDIQGRTFVYSDMGSLMSSFTFSSFTSRLCGNGFVFGGLLPNVAVPYPSGGTISLPSLAVWTPLSGVVKVQDRLESPIAGLQIALGSGHPNDLGQLMTVGVLNGQRVNVLLTPVPEPATLTALALGLVACLRRKKTGQSSKL